MNDEQFLELVNALKNKKTPLESRREAIDLLIERAQIRCAKKEIEIRKRKYNKEFVRIKNLIRFYKEGKLLVRNTQNWESRLWIHKVKEYLSLRDEFLFLELPFNDYSDVINSEKKKEKKLSHLYRLKVLNKIILREIDKLEQMPKD